MEVITLGIISVIFLIVLIIPTKNAEEDVIEDPTFWREYKDKNEEILYHPVTGYSGNKVNMDAYIINRERELYNDNR